MPECSAPGCQLPVHQSWENAEQRAEQLRKAGADLVAKAKAEAAELRARADREMDEAARQAAADDFRLCAGHAARVNIETLGTLLATANGGNPAVREEAIADALTDLEFGQRDGRGGRQRVRR
jgi:hypothetical protein